MKSERSPRQLAALLKVLRSENVTAFKETEHGVELEFGPSLQVADAGAADADLPGDGHEDPRFFLERFNRKPAAKDTQ